MRWSLSRLCRALRRLRSRSISAQVKAATTAAGWARRGRGSRRRRWTPATAGRSASAAGTTTLRQSVTPPSLLGRVSAINIMAYGARPLGAALGAVVGGLWGAESCLYLAVAIFAAQALVIWMSQAVSLERQPEMASD